jgi:DNA polymerase-3 subunit beta
MKKITIQTKQFSQALSKASKVVLDKPIVPILVNSLFEFGINSLRVTSSDLSTSLTHKLNIDCEHEFDVCINPKSLLDYISNISDEFIDLVFEDGSLTVRHKKGHYKISTEEALHFPTVEPDLQQSDFEIESTELVDIVSRLLKTTVPDTSKPAFGALWLHQNSDGIVDFACINNATTQIIKTKINSSTEIKAIGCNADGYKSLVSVLTSIANVFVHIRSNRLFFETESLIVGIQRIDERIPPYEDVFPKEFEQYGVVSRSELKTAIKMAQAAASGSIELGVSMEFFGDSLRLNIENFNSNSESETTIDAELNSAFRTFVNPSFVLKALDVMASERVKFESIEENRMIRISPFGDDDVSIFIAPMMRPTKPSTQSK